MKAVQITSYAGPGALEYREVAEPEPGAGQVTIDVSFAGANYVEALFAEGLFPDLPVPWIPGIEAAGTVRALGDGVTGLTVGQAVAALTLGDSGAYGEVAVAHAHLVVPLPAGLDPAIAAAVPSNTTTALMALDRAGHLAAGEHVLVHAAVGGLGSQLGQLARHLGAARVVGVVGSEEKRRFARSLGYDEVWLRGELAGHSAERFDVIADPVSGPGRSASLNLLRLDGRLLAVGGAAQAGDQLLSSNTIWLHSISVAGFTLGTYAAAKPAVVGEYLRRSLELVASGVLNVHVSAVVPIRSAATVLADLRRGTTVGKVVFQHGR